MQTQAFLDLLFERARREGLDKCEAYLSTGESFAAQVNAGEVIEYSVSGSIGLGFRALIDGKMGYASTQALDEGAIELLIEGVRTNAALIESGDEQFLFAGSGRYPALDRYNKAIDELRAEDKLQLAVRAERAALGTDPRMAQTDYCGIASGSGTVRIVNSLGLDVSHGDNILFAAVAPVARDGDSVNVGMEYAVVRDPKELDVEALGRAAAGDALSGLDARPVPSGQYGVVLKNTAAAELLGVFQGIFSADNAQKGLSLLAGREGDEIASRAVTLSDDPFHPLGSSGAPFDAEGVAAYEKHLIDGGRLVTLLHNLKTAKKQGLAASTANASKPSYASPVGVAASNLLIRPGEVALDALLQQMGEGLLICELQGLHAGANPISGDFSLSAKGFVVEGGKRARAASQITVSGNFYALLKGIVAVGSDLRFLMPGASCIGSPSVWADALSIAGI